MHLRTVLQNNLRLETHGQDENYQLALEIFSSYS
jgi:hypothetical protein